MWILSTSGFLSMVEDRDNSDLLQVRARDPQDIEAHFPAASVITVSGADYRYRCRLERESVAQRVAQAVRDIRYSSHAKDEMIRSAPPNAARADALYRCWSALSELQDYEPYATVPRARRRRWWEDDA